MGFDAAELPRRTVRGPQSTRRPAELSRADRNGKQGGDSRRHGADRRNPGLGHNHSRRHSLPRRRRPPARSTVLVVEHRPLVRAGLLALLGQTADSVQVVGEIDSGDDALDAYRLLQPDVVLIDVGIAERARSDWSAPCADQPGRRRGRRRRRRIAGDGRLRELVQAGARAAVMIEADAPAFARAIHAAAGVRPCSPTRCCTACTTTPLSYRASRSP